MDGCGAAVGSVCDNALGSGHEIHQRAGACSIQEDRRLQNRRGRSLVEEVDCAILVPGVFGLKAWFTVQVWPAV